MNQMRVLGWDIGGANTKAALAYGEQLRVVTRSYQIWENPERLGSVLAEIAGELESPDLMAITLTAELADCFETKAAGVNFVLGALESTFPHTPLHIFSLEGRFCSVNEARLTPYSVASANWAATAHLLAKEAGEALLVDIGTTTTDIIPIVGGEVATGGLTDPERLASGELVYTGVVRTPVCAIALKVPFRGRRCRIAAELFAQSGDVHVWLGNLSERDYSCRAPDGRGPSRAESGARLARSICADSTLVAEHEITRIAEHLAGRQVGAITAAIRQVQGRLGALAPETILGAGLGSFLARAAAKRAGLAYHSLSERLDGAASRALPAVAVARLLQRASR